VRRRASVRFSEAWDDTWGGRAGGQPAGAGDAVHRPPLDKVIDHLRDAEALILLDNCEHVIDAAAAVADTLLGRSERVRVLATSRRTLAIAGEHLFAVPPPAVPDEPGLASARALSQYDAVMLLVDRAAALQPGFSITDRNRLAAARLCARLDGLPLAIELAATRLRSLSLSQLVDRLESRFALLTGGNRTAQPRQQTLRAVIDWSYSLCSPEQRLLWARL
jgi:predicted ATPase